ncbi:MAG TPA: hypothetical protein VLA19_25930, partial [Herpetosiphonaceae bacterium]|nr:hypothetical protein [Herpetosiphonaceae bacterium]
MDTTVTAPEVAAESAKLNGLLPALRWLDRRIERALAAADGTYGPAARMDPFRGLHISEHDVEQLLARDPGSPPFDALPGVAAATEDDPSHDAAPLAWLARAFGLSGFDLDVVLVALAPEIDLRYERLYAYL